jgi:hypothetical protein
MPKTNPVAELAQKMLDRLRQHRPQGAPPGDWPLTVARLAPLADPQATPEQVSKALAKKPFVAEWVLAHKKDPASPIVLAEETDALAGSPRLLEYALGQLCSADKPLHPLAKVVGKVDKALQPAFQAALERQLAENTLPATVGTRTVKDKPHLYLQQYPPPPPKRPPAEELSEKLLQTLSVQRAQGPQAYPLSLNRLVEQTAAAAKPALVKQAIAREPFRSQVVLAAPRRADTLVALAEDRDRLIAGDALLEYLLEVTTSAKKPVASLDGLLVPLADELRKPFEDAWQQRLTTGTLPDTVARLPGDEVPELVLKRALAPAQLLAVQMLQALAAHPLHPRTLQELARQVEPQAGEDLLHRARNEKLLKARVFPVVPKSPGSPFALSGEAPQLAGSPRLLPMALAAARTPENQALPLTDLKRKLHKALQKPFADRVNEQLAAHALPSGVGLLLIKRKPLLFLLDEINASWPAPPRTADRPAREEEKPPAAAPVDFEQLFEEAFTRLNREHGSHNHVSLVALREAVPVDRATFDAGLQQLRRNGRYSLSAAEGRHGISPEEQEAAIREDGSLLLFVSRKSFV